MKVPPNNSLRPYITALKFMGFTQDYDSQAGGGRTVQFSRTADRRRVEVQLFEDGAHRASHMYYRDDACNYGRMTTYSTPFSSGAGMLSAIAHEMTRTDNEIVRVERNHPLQEAQRRTLEGLMDMIPNLSDNSEVGPQSLPHLKWMIERCLREGGNWPADKIGRWIGYVQGILASRSLLNVDKERDRTRPFFHEAYQKMGLTIPKSADNSAAPADAPPC